VDLEPAHSEWKGQPLTIKTVTKWWAWNPRYLVICILATLGSLISGFIPGWGGVVNVACTIIAIFTGFKAGVQYHREIIG
jgi:uncharacterized protein involved in cysteine biosynthesis